MQNKTTMLRRHWYLITVVSALIVSVVFFLVTFFIFENQAQVDQTTVGFIYLGNVDSDQYDDILTREINLWKNHANYQITYQGYTYDIDMTVFDFDLSATLSSLEKDVNNTAVFTINTQNQALLIQEISDGYLEGDSSKLTAQTLFDDLLEDVGDLFSRKIYALEDYLVASLGESIIDQATLSSIEVLDVNQILSQVTQIEIPKNERFSLLDALDGLTMTNNQMSIVASGLLAVSKEINFNGFIFNQNLTLPAWASYGNNVRILQVNQLDLTFFNQSNQDLTLTMESTAANSLTFKLIGYPLVTTYTFSEEAQIVIPYQTVYVDDPTINDTTPGVIVIDEPTQTTYRVLSQSGQNGTVIFFNRTIERVGEDPVTIRVFSEQYLPTDEVYLQNIVLKDGD